jgi:hypothetical protein
MFCNIVCSEGSQSEIVAKICFVRAWVEVDFVELVLLRKRG